MENEENILGKEKIGKLILNTMYNIAISKLTIQHS